MPMTSADITGVAGQKPQEPVIVPKPEIPIVNEQDAVAASVVLQKTGRQEKWDRRFLAIAKEVAGWSKDPSVGVGAVIVKDRRIIATGYNGFPAKLYDDPAKLANRPMKYARTVHAEMNAILQAGIEAQGATIYVYPSFARKEDNVADICDNCAKHAIQAGIVGIVQFDSSKDPELTNRWLDSLKLSTEMWIEAGNFIRSYPENK